VFWVLSGILHFGLCIFDSAFWALNSALCTLDCALWSLHCGLTVHLGLCNLDYAFWSLRFGLCVLVSAFWSLHFSFCILVSVFSSLHFGLGSGLCVLNSVSWTASSTVSFGLCVCSPHYQRGSSTALPISVAFAVQRRYHPAVVSSATPPCAPDHQTTFSCEPSSRQQTRLAVV